MVKRHQRVHEVPYHLIGSMENMWAILMHIDILYLLTIEVTSYMRALVNHEYRLAYLLQAISHHRAGQSRSDNQVIIF